MKGSIQSTRQRSATATEAVMPIAPFDPTPAAYVAFLAIGLIAVVGGRR